MPHTHLVTYSKGEKSKFFTDIKQGLMNNTKSIWEEMQTTIKIVFENTKIDSLTVSLQLIASFITCF